MITKRSRLARLSDLVERFGLSVGDKIVEAVRLSALFSLVLVVLVLPLVLNIRLLSVLIVTCLLKNNLKSTYSRNLHLFF